MTPFADSIKRKIIAAFLISVLSAPISSSAAGEAAPDHNDPEIPFAFINYATPDALSFKELVEIDRPGGISSALKAKLQTLFNTPSISNEAHFNLVATELSQNDKLGQFIRVGFWNINRGTNLDDIRLAIENPERFKQRIKALPGTDRHRQAIEELEVLRSVDVLAINEADLGIKRSGYRDVVREMAAALGMNYVYGVEFIEIDPENLGTGEAVADKVKRELALVDKDRYRGLHGTAILSRFPIKQARLVPLNNQPYDWHLQEKKRVSLAETARRGLGKVAFQQDVPREIRFGGRTVLIAELAIPQLDGGRLTVVATHLENRCKPSERRLQLKEVLSLIKGIDGPVVLAGDLNTSGASQRPTTIGNEIMRRIASRNFWTKRALQTFVPVGFAFDLLFESISYARTASDPTSKGIFLFAPNPEAGFFEELKRFRFADGYSFDFRGDPRRTINGTGGTLANSNHRAITKGFISTHAVKRPYWTVGKTKLDWIFVKGYAKDPACMGEPYRLAPHFARTLEKLNYSLGNRLSDHNPITVDLPIREPRL